MTGRRRFIAKAGGIVTAVAATPIVDAANVIAQPKVTAAEREGFRVRGAG